MKMGRDGTSGSAFPAVITQLTVTGHITHTFRQVHSYVSISMSVFFMKEKMFYLRSSCLFLSGKALAADTQRSIYIGKTRL